MTADAFVVSRRRADLSRLVRRSSKSEGGGRTNPTKAIGPTDVFCLTCRTIVVRPYRAGASSSR